MSEPVVLTGDSNQALGLGRYAIDFLREGRPSETVLERTSLFYVDAVLCGLSALACGTNAPVVLRREALEYPIENGATVFGSTVPLHAEKAICANCAAVREWDSNGTNFGYRPERGHTAGEFGHNDFYPVSIAGSQIASLDGAAALRAMVCLDEIRGRLAEVFSLKTYKIDHVLHGGIASAAVYGALAGATAEEIESAIGMVVAHYVPFRAIRAGKQLSDSKGSSAALSTEAAITCVHRSMAGFLGPRDIFRNPEAIFRLFAGGEGDASPFDLALSREGDDFAVMGMHFKLGLYEHQSAGAIQGVIELLQKNPQLCRPGAIEAIRIAAYEPAFSIIGDPAKTNPTTRQSADHSMAYIIATLLRKAAQAGDIAGLSTDDLWKSLMLTPDDYADAALHDDLTRSIMAKIQFVHGGPEYDAKYPDGIPTSVVIVDGAGASHDSGLVMYPAGHARNTTADLRAILDNKFHTLGMLAFDDPRPIIDRYAHVASLSADELRSLHAHQLTVGEA